MKAPGSSTAREIRVPLALFLAFAAFSCGLRAQTPAASPQASAAPSVSKPSGTPAASATLILRTSLSSKNQQGKEVKTLLQQAVTLPTGEVLPRGTLITGKLLQSSAHSKQHPNGAIDLLFNEAQPKDAPAIPIVVRLRGLAQSVASATTRTSLPSKHDYVGGTSNTKGDEKLLFSMGDSTSLQSNFKASGIDGIYLEASPQGSGIILAVGDELFLDSDIQITVALARAKQPVPPALPAKP